MPELELANWQTAEARVLSVFVELRNVCSNGETKTQEKTGLRSRFVEMSVGQDKFADTFLGLDNLGGEVKNGSG